MSEGAKNTDMAVSRGCVAASSLLHFELQLFKQVYSVNIYLFSYKYMDGVLVCIWSRGRISNCFFWVNKVSRSQWLGEDIEQGFPGPKAKRKR